jgi:hypothetical protein
MAKTSGNLVKGSFQFTADLGRDAIEQISGELCHLLADVFTLCI